MKLLPLLLCLIASAAVADTASYFPHLTEAGCAHPVNGHCQFAEKYPTESHGWHDNPTGVSQSGDPVANREQGCTITCMASDIPTSGLLRDKDGNTIFECGGGRVKVDCY